MNEVTTLANGWLQVKIPLPFSLKWINSYVIPEQEGYTIIDPGLRTVEAIELWDKVLQQYNIQWNSIARIVLTHQHPDHYGLAGYMQMKSGCSVYISKRSHQYALRLWGEESDYPAALRELYLEHGMPAHVMDSIADNLASFIEKVSPHPKVSYIEAGESIMLGGVSWVLIDAPGHAFGGLCFYQIEWGWMICGDQVLPRITPNVSVVPGEERDPLAAFLQSLEELKSYEVKLALPGHRDPFTDFQGRIIELQAHHARRLKGMVEQLSEQPRNAFDLCESLFGGRLRDNPHNLRFAMSETLAHLFHLEEQGLVHSKRIDDLLIFSTE
ncbi:MBL fold metallo-hydrolase [Paenibacillus sp. L3-i20]|nr:MBL fold metallo-hydrolase [Paenibacillus sp. L3-i20]